MHTKAHEWKICLAYNRPVNIVQILPSAKSQWISEFTFHCPALRCLCIHSSEEVKSRKRLVPDAGLIVASPTRSGTDCWAQNGSTSRKRLVPDAINTSAICYRCRPYCGITNTQWYRLLGTKWQHQQKKVGS